MVELWKMSFHFFPLEEMILCLFTHWWDEIELPGHRIRFLNVERTE